MLRPGRNIVLRSCVHHVLRTSQLPNVFQWRLVPGLLARSHECRHLGNADHLHRFIPDHVLCRLSPGVLRQLQRLHNTLCTGVQYLYIVRPSEHLLDLHRRLRTMQYLQYVHHGVCPGLHQLLAVLDVQLLSVGMLDLLKLLGHADGNTGVLPGNSERMFNLLSDHNDAFIDVRAASCVRE